MNSLPSNPTNIHTLGQQAYMTHTLCCTDTSNTRNVGVSDTDTSTRHGQATDTPRTRLGYGQWRGHSVDTVKTYPGHGQPEVKTRNSDFGVIHSDYGV